MPQAKRVRPPHYEAPTEWTATFRNGRIWQGWGCNTAYSGIKPVAGAAAATDRAKGCQHRFMSEAM